MSYNHKITDLKYRINGLVPKKICNKFISLINKYEDLTSKESSYKYTDNVIKEDNFKCLNLSLINNPNEEVKEALDLAKLYISIATTNYVNYIKTKKISPTFSNELIKSTFNIRILKYEVGNFIEDHSDVEQNIRASCTLNLNEDYEGGEFRFFDGKIKETFKTGDAMLFPAEPIWIHGTEPVTKGTRYSINCFLHQ